MHSAKDNIPINDEDKSLSYVAFKTRHLNEDIEGIDLYEEIYGKEKVRTLHVLLVLCLNLAVDPPDVLTKVSPCSKVEAWLDPKEKNLARALEVIGKNLQNQYERWQPKARYRQSLDPTIEEVHRLCQSLRRSARDERFLFHYNGHGVPRPTDNGEIWVFNKTYTKYIPLSLLDLQNWMGSPSVYVFDCNNAGRIIRMMEAFSNKHKEPSSVTPTLMDSNIILAACHESEDIPLNPEVPADLFTSCLTTPIKMALKWYLLRSKVLFPDYLEESMLDLITGSPSNRVSMFGEINWVFTAVTDTIAWSCLPTPLFQKLFRQDLLVASLFRNFLLAERIMHYYGVRPQSHPVLPHTYNHPMWDAWDHALDGYMCQLPEIKRKKEQLLVSDNEENLPIIRHPPDDPPSTGQYMVYSNDSTEDEDDYIEDEDDHVQEKICVDPLKPRSFLMSRETSDNITSKTEKYFPPKIIQPRNAVDMEGSDIGRPPIRNQPTCTEEALLHAPDNSKNPVPTYINTAANQVVQTIPNIRPMRSISQSNKNSVIVKSNNINPLNGSCSDYVSFIHTDFFNDHMTAFDIWLKTADEKKPVPMQLPILLQVLLSQVHRNRALRLISEYMDLGQWAVVHCLTVGIFPYVIRLLQSPVSDVKPYLVFIWGKIIASAQTDFAKNDVVKDTGYKYFVSCLTENEPREILVKTIAVFALAKMLNNNPVGQKLYIKQNITTILISELEYNPPDLDNENFIRLRIWFILCFAKLWFENDEAKWYGVRQNINEKLLIYLKDSSPEVRAATVYAFGTFLNNKADDGIRSKHSVQVEQNVCQHLLNHSVNDSSPLVRAELVVTMKYMVNLFSNQVVSMAAYHDDLVFRNNILETVKHLSPSSPAMARALRSRQGSVPGIGSDLLRSSQKSLILDPIFHSLATDRVPSVSNFRSNSSVSQICNIYAQMWGSLVHLSKDPHPKVSVLAQKIVNAVQQHTGERYEITETLVPTKDVNAEPPGSPKLSRSPVHMKGVPSVKHSAMFTTHNHKVDQISSLTSSDTFSEKSVFSNEESYEFDLKDVKTDFFNWSSRYFTQSLLPFHKLITKIPSVSEKLVTKRTDHIGPFDNLRSFDKISLRNLPNLSLVDQKPRPSANRLLHLVEMAHLEDQSGRMKMQREMREDGALKWSAGVNAVNGTQLSQVFLQKINSKPELLKFHPYLNYLAVADNCGVSLWNWESGHRAQYMLSRSVSNRSENQGVDGFITSLEFINCEEERGGLLSVGTMDGKIKIWRNYLRDMGQDPDIVTAWHALPDQIASDRPSGLITHWAQLSGQFTFSGDVRYVRLWDSGQESKVLDMHTNCDSCVTSLDRTKDGRLVVAGFGDGHVKLFDTRAPTNESTISAAFTDPGWIHKVAFSDNNAMVYSVGTNGEVSHWWLQQRDPGKLFTASNRRLTSVKKEVTKNVGMTKAQYRDGLLHSQFKPNSKITLAKGDNNILKIQPVHCADLRVASASVKDHVAIIGYGRESRGILTAECSTGTVNSNFKFYEGFSRANIEAPTAVCVHPYQSLVGAGLEDCNLLLLKLQSK